MLKKCVYKINNKHQIFVKRTMMKVDGVLMTKAYNIA